MMKGRNSELDGEWAGTGDKTSFKSNLFITTPDGIKIPMDRVEDSMPTWDSIPAGCTITYEVQTGCDDDRVNLKLTYFDLERYMKTYNSTMDSLPELDLKKLEEGDEKLLEEINQQTIEKIGVENLFVNIWSDVISTNDDGFATGDILLNENWPMTSYLFTAHYGYSAELESSNSSKTWSAVWDWADLALMGIASFIPGLNVVVWSAFAIEMALLGASMVASGFGAASENKCGDYFPTLGFNHIYVFNIETPEAKKERETLISNENQSILEQMNTIIQAKGMVKIAGLGGGIILLASLLKRRRNG